MSGGVRPVRTPPRALPRTAAAGVRHTIPSGGLVRVESQRPRWEFVLRGLIVYAALLFLMRVSGKRQIGQLSPLDWCCC